MSIPANVLLENQLRQSAKKLGTTAPASGGYAAPGQSPASGNPNQRQTRLTEYFGSGNVGATPGLLVLNYNPQRNYLLIQNTGTVSDVRVRIGALSEQFNGFTNGLAGFVLPANGGFWEPFVVPVDFISISWNTANGVVYVVEGVAP